MPIPQTRAAIDELMGWAQEKFGPDTEIGKLARVARFEERLDAVIAVYFAREGWLVGLSEAEAGGYSAHDVQEAARKSRTD